MTKQEKLIENYEDALFAVLMDKVAEEEGAKLREENQRLKEDPNAAVPKHIDAAARQTIRKAYAGKNRHSALHVAKRVLNTVAILVLICSAVFVTAYAAFPEVRVKTLNLLIQTSDVASKLALVGDSEESGLTDEDAERYIICGYSIPRPLEFSLVEKEEDKHGGWVKFEKDTGEVIRVSIVFTGAEYIDMENVDRSEEIQINGYSGMLVEKGNRTTITWVEEKQNAHITVSCIDLNSSFALLTAEQILCIEE